MNTAHQVHHILQMHRRGAPKADEINGGFVSTCEGCHWTGGWGQFELHQAMLICSVGGVWTPDEWWLEDRPEVGWTVDAEKWCDLFCMANALKRMGITEPDPSIRLHKPRCPIDNPLQE